MRNCIILLCLSLVTIQFQAKAQLTDGAYISQTGTTKNLILVKNHYLSFINYDDSNKHFGYTWGGPIQQQGNNVTITIEYDTKDSTHIGKTADLYFKILNGSIQIKTPYSEKVFTRQQTIAQDLDDLWRITGRKQEAKMHTIPKTDRKTIKILVDGYFQWIAINPAQKGFYGTGGGYYSFKNNLYTEKILFFSRDNTRVGQELDFTGKLEDNEWHHSGKSSKGDDIYEIWSKELAN
ncbi:hypothetical protein [Sphingobacterium sp. HMA12]|uniref:hypothetical protein n=1 Tax=Sphingobacterium sp. HMA12 TaxID=2050894 RepID=UPI000CE9BC9D|nr:hypothetical protein [Sphingobacterium sp. HMA12]